eukprot:symbB.v1.2.020304.t1/scaffold1701.1/size126048/4
MAQPPSMTPLATAGAVVERLTSLERTVFELTKAHTEVRNRVEHLEAKRGASGTNPSPLASRIYDDSHSSGTEEDLVEMAKNDTDHPVESKEGYVFSENCWDAVICFGHPSIGWGSSMVLLFLLAFTVFLQLVFCYMVYTSFTENPFEKSSVTALRFWRVDIAHQATLLSASCPGLLGDFVYLSPGLEITVKNLQEKMLWYINQPRVLQRTIPPCPASCMASNGLHAIDQFALVLALGEAVRPTGEGCFSLDAEKYSHWYPRTPKTQVTHDKNIDACQMVQPIEMLTGYSSTEEGEDAKLKMIFAALVLLFTALASLLCAFTEEKGSNPAADDWKDMCSS